MFPRPFFPAVLIAICTMAGAAHAASATTAAAAAADEGVPDDGVTQEIAPKPALPLVSPSAPAVAVEDAGGAGSAIYSPFAGVSELQAGAGKAGSTSPPTAVADVVLPLLAALAGMAAFVLLLRRRR